MISRFDTLRADAPDLDALGAQVDDLITKLDEAPSADAARAIVEQFEVLGRQAELWFCLAHVRFTQDTRDADAVATRERADAARPQMVALNDRFKRALLASRWRADLEQRLGQHAFNLWSCDVQSFDPAIQDDMVHEANLQAEYVALVSGAQVELRGESYNLSELRKFASDPDRSLRHEAEQARWAWVQRVSAELDRIYDALVTVRATMAKKLGLPHYTALAYRKLQRTDYTHEQVALWRDEIRRVIVPIATQLRREQAALLGIDRVMAWDEALHDDRAAPAPQGDHDWMVERAREMFDAMGHGLDTLFRDMADHGYLDLKSREGKAGGGYCTEVPTTGLPFVFANFNGTRGDIEVFTHELGHAFQYASASQNQPLQAYHWPTMEAAEIHSMSLEFLAWEHMERFFGEEAHRFRRAHMAESLLFLPYGACVDHFQHEVYARPELTPQERVALWAKLEAEYMPWRQWGDVAPLATGRRWQLQAHIYELPFYYIDYTLAQCCALQFWAWHKRDPQAAMSAYVALSKLGGALPFSQLVASAGLRSPFEPGCLDEVADEARQFLAT